MRILLLFALLLGTACKSEPPTPALPAPWTELAAPVGSGVVESTTPEEIHIRYDGEDRMKLFGAYHDALEKDGWVAGEPLGIPGLTTVAFTRGDESIDLTVSGRGSRADVLITK
ncbi:MAG: hypothetical protein JRI25_05940 [Deltaproteobacteria bacterium]|nr:hypothetical protein [Deltaproteobacteria bacterium]MBW2254125.1 hypothetical protein [Deltaproteobacteria bacterium]